MTDSTPAATAGQEVLITRIFDAPREHVFKAWLDPDEVAAWYGPEHFEMPRDRIHIDPHVGGRYELTMVRRDGGGEFTFGYEILELVEPDLLVLRSDPMPEMGMHESTITRVELHDHGAMTRMTLTDGPTPRAAATPRPAGTPRSTSSRHTSPPEPLSCLRSEGPRCCPIIWARATRRCPRRPGTAAIDLLPQRDVSGDHQQAFAELLAAEELAARR